MWIVNVGYIVFCSTVSGRTFCKCKQVVCFTKNNVCCLKFSLHILLIRFCEKKAGAADVDISAVLFVVAYRKLCIFALQVEPIKLSRYQYGCFCSQ